MLTTSRRYDFFTVFSSSINLAKKFAQFDEVINQLGFTKVIDKDDEDTTVMHLDFEIDFKAMKV